MNKIEQLLKKFGIDPKDGLENAQARLTEHLEAQLGEAKTSALMKRVETYFAEYVEEETSQELETNETLKEDLEVVEDLAPDEPVESPKMSEEVIEESTNEAVEDTSKSIEEIYRSYNNGNRLNKIWLTLAIAQVLLVYFLIDNIMIGMRRTGKISLTLQLMSLIVVLVSLFAYYLDRQNFEFRKKSLSRRFFLSSNLTSLLGLLLTYSLDKYQGGTGFDSFTIGIVMLRLSLMFGMIAIFTLYLSAFQKVEIQVKTQGLEEKEV